MGVKVAGDFDDTNSVLFEQEVISVPITQVEAIASGTDIDDRQFVRVYNNGNRTIYFGPTGVTSSTGEPLLKKQWIEIALKGQSLFLISASGVGSVIVTDLG